MRCVLGRTRVHATPRDNHIHIELHKLSRKRRDVIEFPPAISLLNNNRFSLDIAKLAQTLAERLSGIGVPVFISLVRRL